MSADTVKSGGLDRVVALCDYVVKASDPKMKWKWGEALFGYALSLLDDFRGESRYDRFLQDYCDYYMVNTPAVDMADTAAPGLITYVCQKRHPEKGYEKLTKQVLDYIRNEPRILGDAVNHLGSSLIGRFYPKSIWVDSLMMFGVFPSLYGKEQGDQNLIDIAARQPGAYRDYMMDARDGLWYHSYWVGLKKHYPVRRLYWARGNGWVMAALPMILKNIGESHEKYKEIAEIFGATAAALLPCQNADGSFNTLLGRRSYRELSATALIAAGLMKGARMGVLDKSFRAAGEKAFACCLDSIHSESDGLFFPEISGPTIPLPLLPGLGYRLVPRARNWSYGLAALIFAAIEHENR